MNKRTAKTLLSSAQEKVDAMSNVTASGISRSRNDWPYLWVHVSANHDGAGWYSTRITKIDGEDAWLLYQDGDTKLGHVTSQVHAESFFGWIKTHPAVDFPPLAEHVKVSS